MLLNLLQVFVIEHFFNQISQIYDSCVCLHMSERETEKFIYFFKFKSNPQSLKNWEPLLYYFYLTTALYSIKKKSCLCLNLSFYKQLQGTVPSSPFKASFSLGIDDEKDTIVAPIVIITSP